MKDQVGFVLDTVALGEVSSSGPAACSSLCQFTYSLLSFALFSFEKDKRAKPEKLPKAMPFRKSWLVNPLNAELNPICHLLALLGAHHILHVSRIRVKSHMYFLKGLFEETVHLL